MKRLLRQHTLPLAVALLSLLLQLNGDTATLMLRFDHPLIAEGEVWRLLTGNLVHLGWNHLWMNLAGLGLIWAIFYRHFNQWQWLAILLVSELGVGVGLWFFNPELHWYVGLSGALHGLFAIGLCAQLRQRDRFDRMLLALFIAKLAWEQWSGELPSSAALAGGPVIVDAHLYGAVTGFVLGVGYWVATRGRSRP